MLTRRGAPYASPRNSSTHVGARRFRARPRCSTATGSRRSRSGTCRTSRQGKRSATSPLCSSPATSRHQSAPMLPSPPSSCSVITSTTTVRPLSSARTPCRCTPAPPTPHLSLRSPCPSPPRPRPHHSHSPISPCDSRSVRSHVALRPGRLRSPSFIPPSFVPRHCSASQRMRRFAYRHGWHTD